MNKNRKRIHINIFPDTETKKISKLIEKINPKKQKGKLGGFKFRKKPIQKELGPSENFFNQNKFSLIFIHVNINQNTTNPKI